MFSFHTTVEEVTNATISGHFGFLFEGTSGKSRDYRDVIVVEKLRLQNVVPPCINEKPAFSNSCGLKSVFEKPLFGDGLVWIVDLTLELKLLFQTALA